MSNRIDQRIVEMSFENAKFEKGILQSKASLQEFAKTLDKAGSGKDFSGLENTIQTVSKSFSALEQIGIGALRRIGESAVMAGTNLFKSLAIAPITQGFSEMELKMNSTQTIMASTGESLGVVNQQLQALNEYSDKTIYSFSDMTANIGKFTNAGVKLEDAVSSIKGISNAAALSGANANEASRAMYNFAQALSSGSVKLMDWKSIELANMGTVEFKQQLLDAGVAAGTLAKQADGMYKVLSKDASGSTMEGVISSTKNFNESLSNQWMTTEVLTGTLSKYADTTTDIGKRATIAATQVTTFSKLMDTLRESVGSGWAQTFEILLGDFNEARELWTGINTSLSTTIGQLADDRNNLLSGGLGSGWKQFMREGVTDTIAFGNTLTSVAKEAGIDLEALVLKSGSMEKALHGNWLTGGMLIKTIGKMSQSVGLMSDEQLKNAGYTSKAKAELLKLNQALISGTLSADDFAKKMSAMSGRENIIQGLKNSVVALLTAIKPLSKAFDQIFPPLTVKTLYQMTDSFKTLTERLIISEATANKIQRTFAGLFAVVDIGWQTVKFLGAALFDVLGVLTPLNDGLLETMATAGDFLVVVNQIIKRSGVFEYGLLGIKIAAVIVGNIISNITNTFSDFIGTLLTAERPLQYLGETMKNVFFGMFETLETGTNWMTSKLFGALNTLQKFFDTKLNFGDGTALTDILNSLKEFLGYVIDGGADGLFTLSDALNTLDFSKIATFVTGGILLVFINQLTRLTKVSADLIATTNTFTSKLTKKLFSPVTQFKDLAFAVGVLSASLFVLSNIPFEKLKVGLGGLAGAMLIFTASYGAMQAITVIGSKKLAGAEPMAAALNLTAMAGGLAILALAISKISEIDRSQVWNSVAVVGAMMGVIVAYQALTVAISLIPGTRAANIGMGLMASGLLGLVTLIMIMDHIKPEVIAQSLVKLTGAMVMLAGIQALFAVAGRVSGGAKVAVNVFGIAGGLLAMIGVIKLINLLDAAEIMDGAKNILLLGGILAAVQTMFSLASRINGGVKFKTNILAMQLGIASMVVLAAIAGRMDQQELQNGIVNISKMAGLIGVLEIITGLAARLGGGQQLQKILGSVTWTMVGFTGLIAVLGNFEQATIDRGFITLMKLTGLILTIEAITATIGAMHGSAKGAGILVGMTLTILSLTASLALLSMIDQEALTQASTALAKTVVAVGVMGIGISMMIKTFGGMSSNFSVLKSIVGNILPGFVALAAVFGAALLFLNAVNAYAPMLQNLDWDALLKFTAGMGIMSAFIGAFTLLSKIPGLGSGGGSLKGLIPGFVAVGALVVATGVMFSLISPVLSTITNMDWSAFGKFTEGLNLLGTMVVQMALLSPIFMLLGVGWEFAAAGVLVAIASVSSVVLAFAGLAFVMEALFDGKSDFLIAGIDKLIIVAEGLGRFVGAIAGGFSSELLVGFGNGLADFSEAVSRIKPASFDGVESLARAMLILTGAALIDGLARFVGLGSNPGELFGKQIAGLINAFGAIDEAMVTKFTRIMATLKPALEGFGTLVGVAGDIPNSGGFIGGFVGNNDIDTFGTKLQSFITTFGTLDETLITQTAANLIALAPAMDEFSTIANETKSIPNSGGFIGGFVGNNDIDTFGTKLQSFITTFGGLSTTLIGTAADNIIALAPAMEDFAALTEAASSIPNSGGLLSGIFGGNDIDTFGTKIKSLIDTFSAIDTTFVATAASNISLMSNIISNMVTVSVELLDTKKTDIADGFTAMFDLTITNCTKYVKEFDTVGFNIAQGLQNGITRGQKSPIIAADKMAFAVEEAARKRLDVRSPSKVFSEIGTWLPVGLANGIQKNSKVAVLASANMGGNVEEAIRNSLGVHSESKKFNDIGSWLAPSIGNGIDKTKNSLLEKAKALGIDTSNLTIESMINGIAGSEGTVTTGINTLLETLSGQTSIQNAASQMGIDTGSSVTTGMANSIDAGSPKVTDSASKAAKSAATQASKDAFQILKESIDKRKEYNRLSVVEEIKIWENFTKQYKVGSEIRMKADKELAQVRYNASKTWIDKEKYYKRLNLEEELAAWGRVQARYEYGHEFRLEAEREIFRLKEEIWQAEYQHALDYVDEEKYYGRMQLNEELAVLKQINAMTTEHSNEKKKNDREIFRVEKEIYEANLSYETKLKQLEKDRAAARKKAGDDYYQHEKEINEQLLKDTNALRAAVEDAIDSRAKTLYSSYGLFDKVDVEESVNGLDLVKNLEDQTKAFDVWQENIGTLAAKGVDEGLIKELRDMGPKASAQLIALNSLSSTELSKYVSLWQQKSADARIQATIELQALRRSTENEIGQITIAANEKLMGYQKVWRDTLTEIDTNTKLQLNAIETEWTGSVGVMTTNGMALIKQYRLDWYNEVDTVVTDTKKQLTDLQTFMNNIKLTIPPITGGFGPSGGGNFNNLGASDLGDRFGGAVAAGYAEGLTGNSSVLVSAAESMSNTINNSMNDFWEIASPAKRTIKTGMYIVMGLAEGLNKFSKVAVTAAGGLGAKAVSAMSSSMDSIPELFDSGVDEISIKPVVDLSDVRSGIDNMHKMFGDIPTLDLSTTMGLLPESIKVPKEDIAKVESTANKTEQPIVSFTQNNYSPTALSRIDIYRQTQNQLSALKGVL